MNKQELLKQYPELIREMLEEAFNLQGINSFKGCANDYINKQTKPEWEILSWSDKNKPSNITNVHRGNELHKQYWNIHSIKRLSDGEVFTLGDTIHHKDDRMNSGKITKITVETGASEYTLICFEGDYRGNPNHTFQNSLKVIVKITPLFTTEDGVEIFEGDTIWFTELDTWEDAYKVEERVTRKGDNRGYAVFSTKQLLENYILMNKPMLSVQAVWDIRGTSKEWLLALKELAKSKL